MGCFSVAGLFFPCENKHTPLNPVSKYDVCPANCSVVGELHPSPPRLPFSVGRLLLFAISCGARRSPLRICSRWQAIRVLKLASPPRTPCSPLFSFSLASLFPILLS